jgi:hypothetical protein
VKDAREKASPPVTTFVSQAVAGQEGTLYYVTTLENTMGGFDTIPSIQSLLGDEGYAKFLTTNAEVVERADTAINHFLPELSNPPQEVISAAPDYWMPKPGVGAKAKPKTEAMVNAADKADKNKSSERNSARCTRRPGLKQGIVRRGVLESTLHFRSRSQFRNDVPEFFSFSSSRAVQSQLPQAQSSEPFSSRHLRRSCASCTLASSKYSSQYGRSSCSAVGQ